MGFYKLYHVKNCVTFFGSAQFNEINPYYQLAYDMAYLLKKSSYNIMTSGFGTIGKICEAANLMHTKKISNFPIIVMGIDFWKNLKSFVAKTMVEYKTIDANEAHFSHMTNNPQEVLDLLSANIQCVPDYKS
ncbi:MAG: hypothetical protein GW903_08770 [Alphaproteobacteria bacterium]|nr:hypothetical protein [Alphaproteobacteria bacterium]NCQ88900.1 hypothetical protein [Alphaproteobacteria bacterium]NCT07803.1 hypothetical protein [Alphaproteobacteria bacterium]